MFPRILNSSPAMPATRRGFRVKPCKCWEWESNPRFRIFTSAQLPRVVSQQANPLPYWNGINRPIHISIGIITAPNIFTNPTSLHIFLCLWAWLDFWQCQFDAPFLECATGVSDSNQYLSKRPTTDWLDQKFMISEAVNFLRHAALECAIPITPTPLSKVRPVEDFWRSTSPSVNSDS